MLVAPNSQATFATIRAALESVAENAACTEALAALTEYETDLRLYIDEAIEQALDTVNDWNDIRP